MDALLVGGTQGATSQSLLGLLKLSGCGCRVLHWLLSEVVSVLSAEVASIMALFVLRNNGAEALSRGLHRSVNERQLSNVVLVNHAEDGLLLAHVHLWILNLLLVGRLQLSLCVSKISVTTYKI